MASARLSFDWRHSCRSTAAATPPAAIDMYEEASLARRGAVDSGLAVAALTQCSAPAHLQVLGVEHDLLVKTLRQAG